MGARSERLCARAPRLSLASIARDLVDQRLDLSNVPQLLIAKIFRILVADAAAPTESPFCCTPPVPQVPYEANHWGHCPARRRGKTKEYCMNQAARALRQLPAVE